MNLAIVIFFLFSFLAPAPCAHALRKAPPSEEFVVTGRVEKIKSYPNRRVYDFHVHVVQKGNNTLQGQTIEVIEDRGFLAGFGLKANKVYLIFIKRVFFDNGKQFTYLNRASEIKDDPRRSNK